MPLQTTTNIQYTGMQPSIKAWATVGGMQPPQSPTGPLHAALKREGPPPRSKQATLMTFFNVPLPHAATTSGVQAAAPNADPRPANEASGRNAEAVAAWQTLTAKMQPPKCSGHQEPCVLRTVKKSGENKGVGQWPLCTWQQPTTGSCRPFVLVLCPPGWAVSWAWAVHVFPVDWQVPGPAGGVFWQPGVD